MPKYVANSYLTKDGQLVRTGDEVELTEEQAKNLGNKVTPASEVEGREGGEVKNLDDMTVKELKAEAKRVGVEGYSNMDREQLIDAIEDQNNE